MTILEAEKFKNDGNRLVQSGMYSEAVESYTKAIEIDPNNHVYYSNRSAAYASLQKYEESLADAEKTVSLKPDWSKGYSRLGASLDFLGRKKEAREAYEKGLKVDPNNEQLKHAIDNFDKEDTGNFLNDPAAFQKLYTDPRTRDFMNDPSFIAKLSNMKNDPMSCFQDPRILTAMGVLTGVDFSSLPNFGETAKQSNNSSHENTKKETPKYRETKETQSVSPADSEKNLGNEAYKKRDFQNALEHYNKAIEIEPKNMIYRLNVAAVYFEQSEYDLCIKTCLEAIDIGREKHEQFKNIAKGFNRIGASYYKQGKLEESLEYYNKSLSENRDPEIVKKVKSIEAEIKQKAELSYINPELADVERNKGNECFSNGEFPNAVKHYTEAIRRNPKDPKLYSNRAACYTKLMEYMLCIKDCEECLKLDPKFVKGYLRKANAFFYLKDPKKAQHEYELALEIDPGNKEALSGIQKCYSEISKMNPEEAAKDALRDPDVQQILSDPAFRLILEKMQQDPSSISAYMRDPLVATKIEKLIDAGIIKVGQR